MDLWRESMPENDLQAAWQELAEQAAQQAAQNKPWLLKLLSEQGAALATRYALWKDRLRRLRQGERRRLQRRLGVSLAGAALLLALSGAPTARAGAPIVADGATCTLAEAIVSANTDTPYGGCTTGYAGADTIDLQADVYLTEYDNSTYGFTGLPVVTSEITIEGNGHTISRDDSATTQVFRILAVFGGDLTLNSATVSGGLGVFGSGIYVSSASLVVSNSTLSGNSALGAGAGIYVGSAAAVEVSNSTLSGNTADTEGGAIYLYSASLALANSVLYNNGAAGYGGGIKAGGYATVTVSNSAIAYNAANYGGGLFAYNAVVDVLNSTLVGNSAGATGGGIDARSATVTVANSTLSGNSADARGGGIYASAATVAVSNSTLSGNSASDGGGIYAYTATVTVSRSLISGNTAASSGNEVYATSVALASNYNLFGHDGEGNAQAFTNFTPSGTDITATSDGTTPTALAAILTTTLADNDSTVTAGAPPGAVVQTLALPAGSPAIDAAPSADCVAPIFDFDQRAKARNVDGNASASSNECDIGAFELQAATGPVPRIIIQKQTRPDGDATPFQFKLRGPTNRSFTLTDNGIKSTGQIPAGIYTLEEILPPGWDPAIPLAQMTCDDGSPLSAIDLGAGEVLVCRFLNYKRGNIVVKKVTLPPVAAPSFAMRLIDNTSLAKTQFSLANGGQFDTGAISSVPTYKLSETAPGGWKKKSIACNNGSPGTAIVAPPGGTVTCTVTNENSAPTNILLSSASVAENKPVGTVVGALTASDAIAGDTHTYAFVDDGTAGASGNGSFQIVGNQLQTKAVFDYETKTSYNIKLKATDTAGQSKVKNFVIKVLDKPG